MKVLCLWVIILLYWCIISVTMKHEVKHRTLKDSVSCFLFFASQHFQRNLIIVTLDRCVCLAHTRPSWYLELWNRGLIELEEQNPFWMVGNKWPTKGLSKKVSYFLLDTSQLSILHKSQNYKCWTTKTKQKSPDHLLLCVLRPIADYSTSIVRITQH